MVLQERMMTSSSLYHITMMSSCALDRPPAHAGKSYVVSNQKSLAQCMESLTQKLHPGVVINFRKIGGVSSPNNGAALAVREDTPMEIDEKGWDNLKIFIHLI